MDHHVKQVITDKYYDEAKMRTRQKRVATDTWRSLGCRTTPLEHWSKRKPTVEPRWAKQQKKKLRSKPTKINGAMLVNRIAHFIKQALSASLLLRALMRPFLSLCNSLFRVSSSFTILCVRLHENAAFAGNQMLYNRGTTRCASSSASWALRVNKKFLIRYSKRF